LKNEKEKEKEKELQTGIRREAKQGAWTVGRAYEERMSPASTLCYFLDEPAPAESKEKSAINGRRKDEESMEKSRMVWMLIWLREREGRVVE
jgi:hypothetical protein